MTETEKVLAVYENNQQQLRTAISLAGGSLDAVMHWPLREVLRSLAMNDITITAGYQVPDSTKPLDTSVFDE